MRDGREAGRTGRRSPAFEAGRLVEGVLAEDEGGSLRHAWRKGLVSRDSGVWEGTKTQLDEESARIFLLGCDM